MSQRDDLFSRFADNREPVRSTQKDADELEAQKKAFLESGGKIDVIPAGKSTFNPSSYFYINGKTDATIKIGGKPHPLKGKKLK